MRQQGVALEHHGGVALIGRELVYRLLPEIYLALVRAFKAGDHAESGGLAAAGGAEQRDKGAGLDGKGGILHRVKVLTGLGVLIYF